jgi:raffinose/stachyose/melibiose transport system permease protein
VGLANFRTLLGDPALVGRLLERARQQPVVLRRPHARPEPHRHRAGRAPIEPALRLAAAYRTAIFVPAILLRGRGLRLEADPVNTWGIAPMFLDAVGLRGTLCALAREGGVRLTTLASISVWQFVGIPMMLIYAALLSIPDEVLEAAEMDGSPAGAASGACSSADPARDRDHLDPDLRGQLQRLRPDLRRAGGLAGPDFATDILGHVPLPTFFGFQLQLGDPHMGAAIATAMFLIILAGVCLYLFAVQTRLRRYQF